MVRYVVRVIVAAVAAALGAVRKAAQLYARMMHRGLTGRELPPEYFDGPDGADVAQMEVVEERVEEASPAPAVPTGPTPEDLASARRREVSGIYDWALAAVTDGRRPDELPPRLPRAVRDWLPGLSYDEAQLLVIAGRQGISAHMDGNLVAGVRAVQRLPKAEFVAPDFMPPPAGESFVPRQTLS